MLQEELKDWTDTDIAMFYIAKELGIIGDKSFSDTKWMYCSKNRFSDALYEIGKELEKISVLEYNEDKGQYRWNKQLELKPF
jgi:hypothetical protein